MFYYGMFTSLYLGGKNLSCSSSYPQFRIILHQYYPIDIYKMQKLCRSIILSFPVTTLKYKEIYENNFNNIFDITQCV